MKCANFGWELVDRDQILIDQMMQMNVDDFEFPAGSSEESPVEDDFNDNDSDWTDISDEDEDLEIGDRAIRRRLQGESEFPMEFVAVILFWMIFAYVYSQV